MGKYFRVDLQVHPYRGITLFSILKAMERKNLEGVALLDYRWEPEISLDLVKSIDRKTRENHWWQKSGNVISFTNKKSKKTFWIILGQEVESQDRKWHILSIGARGIKSNSLEEIIKEILRKGGLVIIDHPFADPQRWFRDISPKREKELFTVCQKFRGKIALEWNGYSHPLIRKILRAFGYTNCNKKTERLAKKLAIPFLPTTDLHLKNIKSLKEIGTCSIEIPSENMDFDHLVVSLRENILTFNFRPQRGYVSILHFLQTYGIPLLFPNLK